jgi:uncharacterized protein (DUF4213/DUF364 family)
MVLAVPPGNLAALREICGEEGVELAELGEFGTAGRELVLEDLCLGLPISWAIVRDAQGRRAMGTALTPANEGGDRELRYTGLPTDWRDWPLPDLPGRIMADHPLERCLALTVINAVSQYRLALEELAGVECQSARNFDHPSALNFDQGYLV